MAAKWALRVGADICECESYQDAARAVAEFAGTPKPVFLERLGDYGVATFRQTEDELQQELSNA